MIKKETPFTPLLHEDRTFYPQKDFIDAAHCKDDTLYAYAEKDYLSYWQDRARELDWFCAWDKVLDWQPPHCKWFVNGKMNITYNCLDRHIKAGNGDQIALLWQSEFGEKKQLSYKELLLQVSRFSNVLKKLGVQKGDRVAIYMPMIPEALIAMLACARIGAIHTVVFAGFSADALADRIRDAQCSFVITADGGYRRGKVIPLKLKIDEAVKKTDDQIKAVVIVNRLSPSDSQSHCIMHEDRDYWYHALAETVTDDCNPVVMDAEDVLFILYTSGTTGKPKGIVHTVGGYAVGAYTTNKYVFDLKKSDRFWCTADIGWITGHTYVTYGPLMLGSTIFMYEGAPDYPSQDCFWSMIQEHKITVFYTAPTAIRMFIKWGQNLPKKYDLSSLRLLGSVGEPLNPEAWVWYYATIGGGSCPIVDTWWQTETGSNMIVGLPAVSSMRPGLVGRALPGIEAAIVNENGREIKVGSGYLVIKKPWPSMMRTIWNDDDRFKKTYFKHNDFSVYYSGDAAIKHQDGTFMIIGRTDDVLSVAGHRIGTMELESTIIEHQAVAEVAVVGRYDNIKGQAIVVFVVCKNEASIHEGLVDEIRNFVVKKIGALARPQELYIVKDLPKTRSGKIMRRLLRDVAEKKALGDTTTISDIGVLDEIVKICY